MVNRAASDFLQNRAVLARALRDAGFEVHVAVPREPGAEQAALEGFPVHFYRLQRKSMRLDEELRCVRSLFTLYREVKPTLVHHMGVKPALYGGLAARLAGVPAVVSLFTGLGYLFSTRGRTGRLLRPWVERGIRLGLRHPNCCVVFQNPDERARLLRGGPGTEARGVVIAGSGVDTTTFAPSPEPAGPPVVLMAGRLLWQKGVGEFVAAARALRTAGSNARFVLVGTPDPGHPSAVPWSRLVEWQRQGVVEWLGWRRDMAELIARSHVACLPSYYGEGMPRFLLEAAASGRAIVTTDCSGCREVVRHGVNGLLVPPRDPEALAAAIGSLLADPERRAAMGARGRQLATGQASVEQVIDANLSIYHALLTRAERLRPRASS